jgi:hypothetical protein
MQAAASDAQSFTDGHCNCVADMRKIKRACELRDLMDINAR